jgi:aromatic-L-amino-acid decarboxylase
MGQDDATGRCGDCDIDDFRREGHRIIDRIAEYLSHPDRYAVKSRCRPGEVRAMLPAAPPMTPEPLNRVVDDVERVVVPGLTHWNHPGFMAYFAITGSVPGILAELFSAAFNVNAMLWQTSPAATELEEVTLDWLRQMLGLPQTFFGVVYDTASTSTLCAIAAAREAAGLGVRLQGLNGAPCLRLYTSEQAHSSVEKAVITLGIGQENVRKIPVDDVFRMDVEKLRRAISEDRAAGFHPFCVVATVGTTSTTSIDPVPAIADICEEEQLWLHVDAAYGGAAAILPEMRWILAGCERADSLVINPHKWLFVPIDFSALYTRQPNMLKQAFSLVPAYLETSVDDEVINFMDYGPQLGRRFRALKLWMVIRAFGVAGLQACIREHIHLAQEFAAWVKANPTFELLAPVPFSTVCFRAHPPGITDEGVLDRLNRALLETVNESGEIYLSHTVVAGRYALRLAIGNIRTTRQHVLRAQQLLTTSLERLKNAMQDEIRSGYGGRY